jgi:TonB family protein
VFLAVFVALGQLAARAAQSPVESQLLSRIAQQPAEIGNYLELAKYYRAQRRFDEAERQLMRAIELLREERLQAAQTVTAVVPQQPTLPPRPPQTAVSGDPYQSPVRVGGTIREPFKVRDVKPVYPADAQSARVQGIVILEAIIDRDGYVREARVLRSVPMLDQAAVEAVRQWRYTPTLLNGMPVEVIMTVTVNFSLG